MSHSGGEFAVDRPEEDDYDLLTFGEAGARLEIEIRTVRAYLRQLSARGVGGAEAAAVGDRLRALEAGAERNRAQPINDANFEKFFGYPGKARRNTTW